MSARWSRLLRVAYLLTTDWAAAEDLVQSALVKAWFAWRRIDGDPEPYVRRIVVRTFLSARRRRWRAEVPFDTITVRVHAGPDEEPRPATAAGTAKLLLYLRVPIAEYPFPPAPATIPPFGPVHPGPDEALHRAGVAAGRHRCPAGSTGRLIRPRRRRVRTPGRPASRRAPPARRRSAG